MEDLSDRQSERFLQENISSKLFCGFNITEKRPNHNYFSELHKKIGTSILGVMFNLINDKLRSKGLINILPSLTIQQRSPNWFYGMSVIKR